MPGEPLLRKRWLWDWLRISQKTCNVNRGTIKLRLPWASSWGQLLKGIKSRSMLESKFRICWSAESENERSIISERRAGAWGALRCRTVSRNWGCTIKRWGRRGACPIKRPGWVWQDWPRGTANWKSGIWISNRSLDWRRRQTTTRKGSRKTRIATESQQCCGRAIVRVTTCWCLR